MSVRIHVRACIGYFSIKVLGIEPVGVFLHFESGSGILGSGSDILGRGFGYLNFEEKINKLFIV